MKRRSAMKSLAVVALGLSIVSAVAMAQNAPPPMTQFKFTPIPTPAEPTAIPLYSGLAPGSEKATQREQWSSIMNERVARNVTRPTLTPFLPPKGKGNGAAVIVAPGGAYLMLALDNEGYPVAQWLADHGIAAFVLKYRLDATPADEKEFLAVAGERFGAAAKAGADKVAPIRQPQATMDGVTALKLVRSRAKEWNIDPHRVGLIGFSAGAMTVLEVTLANDASARPDFVGSVYGPMTPVNAPANAPPLFLALAADDPLFGNSGFGIVDSWKKVHAPVELHYYERGDHGFGMRHQKTTSDLWIGQFHAWLEARGLLHAAAK